MLIPTKTVYELGSKPKRYISPFTGGLTFYLQDVEESGVRYALASDGSVADPKTAPKLERAYRCFDCGEYVHVRRGEVRKPYFAHYAERPHPCNAETIAHEAAKRKLVAFLQQGTPEFELLLICQGYIDTFGDIEPCPDEARLERPLRVSDFDYAGVEVSVGSYRLDAAACLKGQVVFGLEVYQSHLVDAPKRAALTAAKLPWAEVYADAVLEQPQPWQVISSSFGPYQCESCVEREVQARAERHRREEAEAARREAYRRAAEREAEHEEHAARIVPVARKGTNLIFGRRDRVGLTFTCLVCNKPVIAVQTDPATVAFWHGSGRRCDARRAWVRAGMTAVYQQLKRAPKNVRLYRRCSGRNCKHVFKEPLPVFDLVTGEEPSLILFGAGKPIMQLVFGREPKLVDAAVVLELRPGKVAHKPTVWWQRKDGRLCDACTQRLTGIETAARERLEAFERELEAHERAKAELFRRRQTPTIRPTQSSSNSDLHLTLLRRKVARLAQDPVRVAQAARFARNYLLAHHIDLEHAQAFGVVVRRCESCRKAVAALYLQNTIGIPAGLEHVLVVQPNRVGPLLYNRCGHCQEKLSNAHEQVEPGRAVYLLPEDLIQAGTLK